MAESTSSRVIVQEFLDIKTGYLTWGAQKLLQQWQQQLKGGFDSLGNLISNLSPAILINGRTGTIGAILSNISAVGVVQPVGMSSATPSQQGAVILPLGATSNMLGTASTQPAGAFDAIGAAATAQANAQTYAAAQATTAQSNAQAFASNASNLTSGTVPVARLSGLSVVITTAKLTSTGANGSMTYTNGLLTSQVQAN